MCTTVVTPEGHWLQSVNDLEEAGIPVPDEAMDDGQGRDECLCGVDVELALRGAGRSWTEDTPGFLDLEVGC